jgi:hypothetical protein
MLAGCSGVLHAPHIDRYLTGSTSWGSLGQAARVMCRADPGPVLDVTGHAVLGCMLPSGSPEHGAGVGRCCVEGQKLLGCSFGRHGGAEI